jgi:hypothetical protein
MITICEFGENRPREGRASLMGVSEITLYACTLKAYGILKSQERREEYV